MVKYSIKDLERLSGIRAHTIRIWEQRYNIIQPQRTDTNIRYYTDADLKRILNISILNNHGIKISRIAELSPEEIHEEVRTIVDLKEDDGDQVEAMIMAMVELNEQRFESIISSNINTLGFLTCIERIIYPFFEKVGVLWQTGAINPAQEHFISNLIRQKIIVAIDSLEIPTLENRKKFVLFLPESELHEIGLLIYSYVLRSAGHAVIYLGQSVPYTDLQQVCDFYKPDALVSLISNPFPVGTLQVFVDRLGKDFSDKKIYLSGYQFSLESIEFPDNVLLNKDLISFRSHF